MLGGDGGSRSGCLCPCSYGGGQSRAGSPLQQVLESSVYIAPTGYHPVRDAVWGLDLPQRGGALRRAP